MALGTLTSSDLPRTKAVLAAKHTGLDVSIALLEDTMMGGELPGSDEAIIRKQMQQPDVERRMKTQPVEGVRFVAGFILASSEFQHRQAGRLERIWKKLLSDARSLVTASRIQTSSFCFSYRFIASIVARATFEAARVSD